MGLEGKKMPFNLFHKKKEIEQETPVVPPQKEPQQEAPIHSREERLQKQVVPVEEKIEEPTVKTDTEQKTEGTEPQIKTYLKAMPLRELSDLENVKTEVKDGNIIILRVTPLASKNIEDVKSAVNELFQFAESIGGDIARLGEERVVLCPKTIRIWREKSPGSVKGSSESLPTAA
jgi:SepF-like predicted cell division protein (DUF552 family)